ncbi:S-formylglutathione hydrolase [Plasmodiophora brassicae]
MALSVVSRVKCFGGAVVKYSHESTSTGTTMRVNVFLPGSASARSPVPALYFLSGLTCTEDNFMEKAGAQRVAQELGIAIICPDTSPRGANVPGESDSWDLGVGAGFYVDAVQEPWSKAYRMYTYVTKELPQLLESELPELKSNCRSVMGHSMGGHGALICYLRNPGMYKSVSAFAPISHPMACPWGTKAFAAYLGSDQETWKQYDATCLIAEHRNVEGARILIDQGLDDKFLASQLLLDDLEAASKSSGLSITIRRHDGYDHSYYFVSTCIEDHIRHHAKFLLHGA